TATGNVLTNDTDPNPSTTLRVSTVNGSANNVGNPVSGTYGSVTIGCTGAYSYTLNNPSPVARARPTRQYVTHLLTHTTHPSTTLAVSVSRRDSSPVAPPPPSSPTRRSAHLPATGNVLTNDTDADSSTTLPVSTVNGSANNVGMPVAGTYGSMTIFSNGAYS